MATIFGGLSLTDTVFDSEGSFAMNGAFGLHSLSIAGRTYVYVAGWYDSGVSVFELTADGQFDFVQTLGDGNATALLNASNISSVALPSGTFVYVNAYGDAGITVYSVADNGSLSYVDAVFDDDTLELNGTEGRTSIIEVGGTSFLIASGSVDDGVSVFRINADGTLTNTANVDNAENAAYALNGANGVATVTSNGTTFVFVAAFEEDGVSAFILDASGNLTFTDSAFDNGTLELYAPLSVAAHEIGGQAYLFVGGRQDDGISVFQVTASGQLINVFNINDTSALGLDGVSSLSILEVDGQVLLAASGRYDEALSIFSVAADGSLSHISTTFDTSGVALDETLSNAFATVGDGTFVITSSFNEDGISAFGFGAGDDTLQGTIDDDRILGLAGNDILNGNGGNDILIGGSGADQMDGGDGFDQANYEGSNGGVTINLGNGSASGGHATGDSLANIEAVVGSAYVDTLFGNDVANILRGEGGADVLRGFSGNDRLFGGDGNDQIFGDVGADILDGGEGNDILQGGAGADQLIGGNGYDQANYANSSSAVAVDLRNGNTIGGDAAGDTLSGIESLVGSAYFDTLLGNNVANILRGENGFDYLRGFAGNDQLFGGNGNDTLIGDAGSDRLLGEAGSDMLYGGANNDQLLGGDGNDILNGGAGADQIHGGDGYDQANYESSGSAVAVDLRNGNTIGGDAEGDTITGIEALVGSAYFDTLLGNGLANILRGENGFDYLRGFGGNDRLFGGNGNDTLLGDAGSDMLEGGSGNDRLTGGLDGDTFVFANGFGRDTITDFDALGNSERIDLSAVTAITDFADLSANHLTQVGANAVITDGTNTLTLSNVDIGDLDANDF
ncbi:beta-propeller fold lactonase family protein, partial [Jiella marina]|uniref:beta-propeller fold lactonase family protein n=1 Tax=Jiella sp. LLJ827 TaxID=2917712 RepID=UPI002100CC44